MTSFVRHRGGFWAAVALVVLFFALPGQALALSMYSETPYIEANTAPPGDLESQAEAARVRKLAGYIQETYRVNSDKAQVIVAEAMFNGARHDIEPELILAVIAVESTFKERAVSPVGARGLMQVMPRFHRDSVAEIGGELALFEPDKNIRVGSAILMTYLEKAEGDLQRALLYYNGSSANPKSPYARKVMRVYNRLKAIATLS